MLPVKTLGVVLMTLLSLGNESTGQRTCTQPVTQRKDCGYYGITRAQCDARNCCWDPVGSPQCFENQEGQVTLARCDIRKPSGRIECGFNGISPEACSDRGCCFDQNTQGELPWCFVSNNGTMRPGRCDTVEPANRKDCGYSGISEAGCRARQCCYEQSSGPWCYHGK